MIYSTNWIERLNKDYKCVLKMRRAMPTPESVIALMGGVAMEKESTTYAYPVYVFRDIEEGINITHFLGHYQVQRLHRHRSVYMAGR